MTGDLALLAITFDKPYYNDHCQAKSTDTAGRYTGESYKWDETQFAIAQHTLEPAPLSTYIPFSREYDTLPDMQCTTSDDVADGNYHEHQGHGNSWLHT